jgi:hypothetical protein
MATQTRGIINRFDSDIVSGTSFANDMPFPPTGEFPNGLVVRIDKFGGSAASDGDGISSDIFLEVSEVTPTNWNTIRRYALDGATETEVLNRTWTSDGNLKFRIRRRNNGSGNKRLSAWLDGYKKESI